MTTFDGAGVRVAPVSPPLVEPSLAFPVPIPNGSEPPRRLIVMTATSTRPTTDRTGASHEPTGPTP